MLKYEAIVSLVFRWIDLFIIFVAIGYVFVRWVLPFFKQEIIEEQKHVQELQDRLDCAIQQSSYLDHLLIDDQETIKRLENQLHQWKMICEKKEYEKHHLHQRILADLKQKNEKKMLGMIHDMVYKRVIPESLDQAERDLKVRYNGGDDGCCFIQKIIAELQKGDA